MWYKESPLNDLLNSNWGGVIGFVVGLIAIALLVGLSSQLSQGLKFGLSILLVFLIGPVILSLLSGGYKFSPLYAFDQASSELTVSQSKASQTYPSSEIVSVRADNTYNDDGSPKYWRKIHLVSRSNLVLELHPGHDQPQKQEEMITLDLSVSVNLVSELTQNSSLDLGRSLLKDLQQLSARGCRLVKAQQITNLSSI